MDQRVAPSLAETVVPFVTEDGLALNLVHVTGPAEPWRGPVLLSHGAGVRASLFRPPVRETVVDALIAHGYDVWLENWRASIDVPPTSWTLDRAARFDHPAAVAAVRRATGAERVKAIVHCQGSVSFVMAAVAGLLPAVTTIVANAVALHPVIPAVTRLKFRLALPLLRLVLDHMDPQWGLHPRGLAPRFMVALVRATHRECENPVCRMASFTYGVGHPTLWSHANLNPATHDWVTREFGRVPVSFFAQMWRSVQAGRIVAAEALPGLPDEYGRAPPLTDARFALFAGADNRCFLPESQCRTFAYLDSHRPDTHSLHVLPGYGHLDMFMGKDAARDVFPRMIAELDRTA